MEELRKAGSTEDSWLRLPPPEEGPLLWNMIRSEAWNCDLLPMGDPREATCRLKEDDVALKPQEIACNMGEPCSIEKANAWRTRHLIGALPCCSTSPFCAAPTCAPGHSPVAPPTCTKRAPEENV